MAAAKLLEAQGASARRTCIHHPDEQLRVKYSGVSEYVRIRDYAYVHSIELEKTHELKEMIKLGMQVG